MTSNILVGGLLMSAGIYAGSFAYFWPQKLGLSPKMPLWVFRLGCIFVFISGLLAVLLPIVIHDH